VTAINISIQGLTDRQSVIADILWNCQSQADADHIVRILGQEAEVVKAMIIAAYFDHITDTDLAKDLLDKFKD
jgi:hypothetical protein